MKRISKLHVLPFLEWQTPLEKMRMIMLHLFGKFYWITLISYFLDTIASIFVSLYCNVALLGILGGIAITLPIAIGIPLWAAIKGRFRGW